MSSTAIPREELFQRLRRSFTRYQFRVQAEMVWQSRRAWGRVVDISRGGMFIGVDNNFRLNATFSVFLALNVPLQLDCRVRRIVPGRGVGVSLTVPRDMKARFDALLLALDFGTDSASTGAPLPVVAERGMAKAAAASAGR
jgi:hypothetical protein